MKKIICVLFAAVLLLSVCGCSSEIEFTAGEWKGNVYTNEYAGINFKMPDDWTHYTDEQLAETMKLSIDAAAGSDEYAQKIAELATVYGMVAMNPEMTANVQVVFENVTVSGNNDMTARGSLDIVVPAFIETFAYYGMESEADEYKIISIGDQEYVFCLVSIYNEGAVVVENGFACKRDGDYITSIVVNSAKEGGVDEILSYFS